MSIDLTDRETAGRPVSFRMDASAKVTLEQVEGGYAITVSRLTLKAPFPAPTRPGSRTWPPRPPARCQS